jgi:hypothetical protein
MAQTLKEVLDEKLKANSLRAPDRNPILAPQADLAKKVKSLLNKYETKKLGKIDSPWNKYAAGHSIGDLLFGESPELLDDMSYGLNPLTSGGRTGRLPIPDKRLLDMPVPLPVEGGLGVIKNKGGNWLTGSVENALKGLKKLPGVDREPGTFDGMTPRAIEQAQIKFAVDDWIDGPLTNYIKNSMATPEDPIRLRADKMAAAAKARLDRDVAKAQKKEYANPRNRENDIQRAQERYDDEMSGILHTEPPEERLITGIRSDSGFPEETSGFHQNPQSPRHH